MRVEDGSLVVSGGARVPLPADAEVTPRDGGDLAVAVYRGGRKYGLIFPAGTHAATAREMVRLLDRRR